MSKNSDRPNKTNSTSSRAPLDEKPFSVAPGVRPFTRWKAIELAVCGVSVILGLLYLYADLLSLAVLLPLYSAAFLAITVLRWLDTRAQGLKGFAAMLPVFCWAFLTAAVIVASCEYFVNG